MKFIKENFDNSVERERKIVKFLEEKDSFDKNYSVGTKEDDVVKSILSDRVTKDRKIRPFADNEKLPRGFRFKSLAGDHGEVSYFGKPFAFAVVDGELKVMPSDKAGSNWSETIFKKDKISESEESVYRVTYKASDKIFSSFMIKAKDKDDAMDKAIAYRKKKYNKDTDIVGAEKMTSDEVEDYKRRGMSLVESIDPEVKKMAEECNVEVFDGFDDFDITVMGKTSDTKEFLKRYYAYKGLDNKEECLKEDVEDATVEVKEEEVDVEPKKSPETDTDMSLANMLNLLIQDEWQAIDGYNGTIATIRSLEENPIDGNMNVDYEGITKILEDIAAEEMNHVGMLQKAMGTVSPNTSEIEGGEKEAEETLDDAGAEE